MKNIVEIYRNNSSLVNDAFDNAVLNLCINKEKYGYKVFYICGCETGVGATSVSVELSISLAGAGLKTLLFDGDLRKDGRFKHLNEETGKGIADYIIGKTGLDEIINETNRENLFYISGGIHHVDSTLKILYSSKMGEMLEKFSNDFDYVIIDGPSISSSVDSSFYGQRADATILVASMDGAKKKYLEQAYERLLKSEVNVIGVIANKAGLEAYKEYAKDYDYFKNKKFISSKYLHGTRYKLRHEEKSETKKRRRPTKGAGQ